MSMSNYETSVPYDQVGALMDQLEVNPTSRRLLVSAWNPGELDRMALPPCPYAFQLLANPKPADAASPCRGELSMIVTWRSVDVGVGLPFDLAAYGLLLEMICKVANYQPAELICHMADCHIYLPHLEALAAQRERCPLALPVLQLLGDHRSLDHWEMDHIKVHGYEPHPAIKMEAFL